MKKQEVNLKYSALLIEFIDPIITGDEDVEEVRLKARLGQIAWNQIVAKENKLAPFKEMQFMILETIPKVPDYNTIIELLTRRKEDHFGEHQQFILKTEVRSKPDESLSLYVETTFAHKMKKL